MANRCKQLVRSTPEVIYNRPALSNIDYRVGTFASFRRTMLNAIAAKPALRDWTTRERSDYGIALLEMWAYIADILTFYQERIANEAFLRTALHEETIRRLAAQLNYEPAPGAAAEALLAFTLEEAAQVQIPVGLRVQSVPGQDERPQKFEAVEALKTHAELNEVPVFPEPERAKALFERGMTSATLNPSQSEAIAEQVSSGDRLVFFGNGTVERKEVVALHERGDGRIDLEWTPEVQANDGVIGSAFKYEAAMRVFGHDAPETYVETSKDASQPGGIKTDVKETSSDPGYDKSLSNNEWLSLDATYDDLKAGTSLLLHSDGPSGFSTHTFTASQVRQRQDTFAPLSATVTQVKVVGLSRGITIDRRYATLYQLASPELVFWPWEAGDVITGDTIFIPSSETMTEEALTGLTGRRLLLTDEEQVIEAATVEKAVAEEYDGITYFRFYLASDLEHDFQTGETVLLGNVARATHGETVTGEVLGSGDASAAFQSFELRKSPVTFVRDAEGEHGVRSTLELRVDGVLWKEADELFGHGGKERIYTVSVDEEKKMRVQVGDGETGARLTSGAGNVTARYRHGLGSEGNVAARRLTTLLDQPTGLKEVVNPKPATGGVEPEARDDVRANAPNTVRTFDRVVSLRDFEDAARAFTGVAKARADWRWDGLDQMVQLTAAGDEGAAVEGALKDDLRTYLDTRRDPNRKLEIASYEEVAVAIEAVVQRDLAYRAEDVREKATDALQDFFAFENVELGQSIHRSDLYHLLQEVEGVVAVKISSFTALEGTPAVDGGQLRIRPHQLAALAPSVDTIITVGEVES